MIRLLATLIMLTLWGYWSALMSPVRVYSLCSIRHTLWLKDGPIGLESASLSIIDAISRGVKALSSPIFYLLFREIPRLKETLDAIFSVAPIQSFAAIGYWATVRSVRYGLAFCFLWPWWIQCAMLLRAKNIVEQTRLKRKSTDWWLVGWQGYRLILAICCVSLVFPILLTPSMVLWTLVVHLISLASFYRHRARR